MPFIAPLLAVVFSFPAIFLGLLADDFLMKARILGDTPIPPARNVALDLFVLAPRTIDGNQAFADAAMLPWWHSLDTKTAFLRPLSALTHQLDYSLWPESPVLMHVHSLIWLGLAVLVVAFLYRRLHGAGLAAGLACLLFAMEDSHAGPAGWIANRNALPALVLSVLALISHDVWRKDRRVWALPLATVAYAAALTGGESALAITAYLFAYALFLDCGPLVRRLATLTPYAVTTALYLSLYKLLGYGVAGSAFYTDPLRFPLAYARAVVDQVPIYLLSQWTPLTVDFWLVLPRAAQVAWTVLGAMVATGLIAVFWPVLRAKAEARFWVVGMTLSLIPVCSSSVPMDRMLLFCSVGGAGLLATAATWSGWPAKTERRGSRLLRRTITALLVVHLCLAVGLKPGRVGAAYIAFGPFHMAERMMPNDPELAQQDVVCINGMEFLLAYVPVIRTFEGGAVPRHIDWLAPLWEDLTVTRADEQSLTIRTEDGFLANRLARTPGDRRFDPGDVVNRKGMTVTVDEVTPAGRPLVATFRFPDSLDSPSLRWLVWVDGELETFDVPAIGETVPVARTMLPLTNIFKEMVAVLTP